MLTINIQHFAFLFSLVCIPIFVYCYFVFVHLFIAVPFVHAVIYACVCVCVCVWYFCKRVKNVNFVIYSYFSVTFIRSKRSVYIAVIVVTDVLWHFALNQKDEVKREQFVKLQLLLLLDGWCLRWSLNDGGVCNQCVRASVCWKHKLCVVCVLVLVYLFLLLLLFSDTFAIWERHPIRIWTSRT